MGYGRRSSGSSYGNGRGRSGFKGSSYKGHKIEFEEKNGRVFARAPDIASQYLGVGKNKTEALQDAQDSIDQIKTKTKVYPDDFPKDEYGIRHGPTFETHLHEHGGRWKLYITEVGHDQGTTRTFSSQKAAEEAEADALKTDYGKAGVSGAFNQGLKMRRAMRDISS